MLRLLSVWAATCVVMVVIAGSGAFLLSRLYIAQSKVDAVSAVAKGVSVTISEQVNLLNSMLDKMVQDPEIITAASQYNPEILAAALTKLQQHFPGILSIKFLFPENIMPVQSSTMTMGFADLEMAQKTFVKNQVSAIQGDTDRHLAIARRIMLNGSPVAVVLVGLNYDFVNRILSTTTLEKGYIELRQGKLVLASVGKKLDDDGLGDEPIKVPNTDWELYYEKSGAASLGEMSLMVGIVVVPALVVILMFAIGHRKLTDLLSEDMNWLLKAFKDIVMEKPLGEYPVKLNLARNLISTLAQFKRVVNDKWFEI